MKDWIRSSLHRKLSFLVAVCILVPLLLLGIFAYVISAGSTEDKMKLTGLDALRQMDANLRFISGDVENMSVFLTGQQEIQQYMASAAQDQKEISEINGMLANLAASKRYILDIAIVPVRAIPALSTGRIETSPMISVQRLNSVKSKTWTGVYHVRGYAKEQSAITFIRPLRSVHDYELLGWICISLNERELAKYWSSPRLGSDGTVVLVDGDRTVLSSASENHLAMPLEQIYPGSASMKWTLVSGTAEIDVEGGRQTLLYYRNANTGWSLVGMIANEDYLAENRFILMLTLAAVLVAFGLGAGIIWFVVQSITRPLRSLELLLSHLDPERPMPAFPVVGQDEIARLGHSYNRLGSHIVRLKEALILQETRKKEADIRALQYQINPHFLYNTLSSIHWIALMSGEHKMADMVESLSDFLRFSLNKGRDFCRVEQELAHIMSYVKVQAIRFPDRFKIEILADESVMDHSMLKLLLQPLVENAITHGLRDQGTQGLIVLRIDQHEDSLHFTVEDNGRGMSVERLNEVNEGLHSGQQFTETDKDVLSGYGLCNVNERLHLYYGPQSSLNITSREGAGTKVTFAIPYARSCLHEGSDR
ncbi:sensor histidine kinase [Paenibacillus sp. P96]|uniref:histidine kinase n=1 Tax=Paenibacillus zeirhizosphaerae TaxID=2987519 RepID=A0ABT9FRZ5_9BACL|nr:sensor histidine kinase [Paenibacillus sp. P96]MDP4097400.1 sensor histidine kinase [Paenibacillus sp. P96]